VQQELIAEIHRTSIWPVVVTVDGNIALRMKGLQVLKYVM